MDQSLNNKAFTETVAKKEVLRSRPLVTLAWCHVGLFLVHAVIAKFLRSFPTFRTVGDS